MMRPIQVAEKNITIAQMPRVNCAAPVIISKKALMISAGAICQQKRINDTLIKSTNQSQGRKVSISQITFQPGSDGIFLYSLFSVVGLKVLMRAPPPFQFAAVDKNVSSSRRLIFDGRRIR